MLYVYSTLYVYLTHLFQIRRTIRKKHTLPNYKFRMKPFFSPPPPRIPQKDLYVYGTKIGQGKLTVTIKGCSRLIDVPADSLLYCTLSVGKRKFVKLAPNWKLFILAVCFIVILDLISYFPFIQYVYICQLFTSVLFLNGRHMSLA